MDDDIASLMHYLNQCIDRYKKRQPNRAIC